MWRDRYRQRYYASGDRHAKMRDLARLAKFSFIGVIVIFLASFVIIPLFAFNLPSPDKVVRREGYSTKILDRSGKVLYDIFSDFRRNPVKIEDVPAYLRQATVAIEDKNFYSHQGFDPIGMVRGFSRLFTQGRAQGGSTLTQQLVKNVLLTSERSVFRKIREFILAIQIERKYTKDEILQMYLSEAPYGGNSLGVETASETYFGKKVSELSLVESAFLAGLPQRPTYYSPYSSNPKAYIGRTQEVLRRMREDGYINKEQEQQAKKDLENLQFQAKGAAFKAPHFVQYVQELLEERYGQTAVEQGGLKVTTTLDLDLQEKAQTVVSEEIAKVENLHITNGAAVVLDPGTGEILAMVGSKNFGATDYDGQVNVTTSLRQPGSAIKPITYATAFKKGYTPSTLIMDVPTVFPGGANQPEYEPVNYDGKYRGPIQLRFALGNSINVPAVKLLAMVGIKDVLTTAYDLGVTTLPPTKETLSRVGLSLTLGGGEVRLLELTGAYSAFMNGGYKVDPTAILKVEDKDGKVLEQHEPKKVKRVLSEEDAFLIANILSDNEARKEVFGPNSLLNVSGRQIAVKTGTTNDRRDNWAIGGGPNLIVGTWVGNNDNSEMKQVASGVSGASPIWRKILLEGLKGKPVATFIIPGNVVTASVDAVSGYRSHDGYASRSEYFRAGTEPGDDPVHTRLKVCRGGDGGLATPSDIASGNYEEKEYFVFKEEDPTANGGPNRWQEGILSWLTTQGDARYHPPTNYCGNSNPVSVDFTDPTDHASNLSSSFTIKIRAQSTAEIVNVDLEIDGARVRSFTGAPYEFNAEGLSDGPHTLFVKARDANGKEADRTIVIGVHGSWEATPAPTPTPIPAP